MKNTFSFLLVLVALYFLQSFVKEATSTEKTTYQKIIHKKVEHKYFFTENNCTKCHKTLEHIRKEESGMMQEILEIANKSGNDGNDCVVCHGGNPKTLKQKEAHQGTIDFFRKDKGPKEFYPDPGSPWINKNTCGMCHKDQVKVQKTSLMFTEAGKIQGSLWSFGGLEGYQHTVGNYDVSELDPHDKLGTEKYQAYMKELKRLEPQVFPNKMHTLPEAPTKDEIAEHPEKAVYTYLRQECLRCHTGNKGRQKRGDFRGMGCSSCHIPYSNQGVYEGNDSIISKMENGHLLSHTIQSTRKVKVAINGHQYSGIPTETCTTCHNRGKRIGTSFQGLMETSYHSPFMGDGEDQPKLHTKHYLHLKEDIHKSKGMLCQDCHTSIDVHGDGNLAGTTLAPVEIECQDCHGTINKSPWELPLGYGDEFGGLGTLNNKPRGLVGKLPKYMEDATTYDPENGYLLTARGNPFGNVIRRDDSIILHTAGGKDLSIKPLKYLSEHKELSLEGEVAMKTITKHNETMECYACHAKWAPQCYGCHINVDYSEPCKRKVDWLKLGHDHDKNGLTGDARKELDKYLIDGEVTETRSYLRWENPPLVVNGENRISTAIPGCQTTITVIGKDGKPLLKNHIFKIPNVEGADEEGQLGIDISPVQPHTISKGSRSCEECHTNPQAVGYGIEGGTLYADPTKRHYVDLKDADGNVLPNNKLTQIDAIENLDMDWSRFVDEDGKQLQTVGHHFKNSRPLNNDERNNLSREGVCISCHQTIPTGDLAVSLLNHVKEVSGQKITTKSHKDLLSKIVHIAAWVQVLFAFLMMGLSAWFVYKFLIKKKK